MRKIFKLLTILFIVLLFYCFIVKVVYAQRELDDYSYQYEKYRGVHDQYIEARNSYLKYQTLASKTELIKASQDFLSSRAIVLKTYFQAVAYLLKQTPDVIPANKSSLILALDQEVTWLTQYGNSVEELTNPTFDDLLEISQRFEDRQEAFQKLGYQTLSNIIIARMRNLQSESGAINFLLEDKIAKNGQGLNPAVLNQWIESVRNMDYTTQANIRKAEDFLSQLNNQDGEESFEFYQNIQEELEKARLNLLNTIEYQKEILKEVGND